MECSHCRGKLFCDCASVQAKTVCPKYVFFDTETTGLPRSWKAPVTDLANWPRLVQIAWESYDGDGNKLCEESFIIKPEGFTIPADSAKVHGISTERAEREGVPLAGVLQKFHDLVNEAEVLVAHNVSFDEKIIGAEFLRARMENILDKKKKICTMENSTKLCAIEGKYGLKWPKLAELHQKLFGADFEEAHNAAVDIRATARCFWEMKRQGIV
ncbi:MAG: 3'-5' exonuclease [Parcubacteria group bacterium]|nr:3'-5' exonuclease [Parcubacteria group bacterium]